MKQCSDELKKLSSCCRGSFDLRNSLRGPLDTKNLSGTVDLPGSAAQIFQNAFIREYTLNQIELLVVIQSIFLN